MMVMWIFDIFSCYSQLLFSSWFFFNAYYVWFYSLLLFEFIFDYRHMTTFLFSIWHQFYCLKFLDSFSKFFRIHFEQKFAQSMYFNSFWFHYAVAREFGPIQSHSLFACSGIFPSKQLCKILYFLLNFATIDSWTLLFCVQIFL